MASIKTRLLLTLLYSWSFEFPLRLDEWISRLYIDVNNPSHRDSQMQVAAAIRDSYKKKLVTREGQFFAPFNTKSTSSLVAIRTKRQTLSQNKIDEISPLIRFCRWLPWVVGVAVTGSVAVANTRENDDVDLMIVCAANRLWLARPLLILFSQLYGKRRTWRGEEGNSWCFNLWMEQHTQRVSADQRSLYTTYEVCQAQWLISKANTKELFFSANRWAGKILPVLFVKAQARSVLWTQKSLFIGIPIIYNILDLANYISYTVQYYYMHRHMTRERVSLHFAAFHPRDTKAQIFHKLQKMIQNT